MSTVHRSWEKTPLTSFLVSRQEKGRLNRVCRLISKRHSKCSLLLDDGRHTCWANSLSLCRRWRDHMCLFLLIESDLVISAAEDRKENSWMEEAITNLELPPQCWDYTKGCCGRKTNLNIGSSLISIAWSLHSFIGYQQLIQKENIADEGRFLFDYQLLNIADESLDKENKLQIMFSFKRRVTESHSCSTSL